MSNRERIIYLYGAMAILLIAVGVFQSWTLSLTILNLCLISAIMSLGVNMQWGYAGLFNVGIMGFAALGGLAGVIVSMPPIPGAWSAGGLGIGLSLLALVGTVGIAVFVRARTSGSVRTLATLAIAVIGYFVIRRFVDPTAAFLFVAASEGAAVADHYDAALFDIEGAFWGHRGDRCTFDALVDELGLETDALRRLAVIVRGTDTGRPDLAPESAGLLAASLGLSRLYSDDLEQLEAGMALYDALYRWARAAAEAPQVSRSSPLLANQETPDE